MNVIITSTSDLTAATVPQLRALAKEYSIKGAWEMNKATLIAAITEAANQQPEFTQVDVEGSDNDLWDMPAPTEETKVASHNPNYEEFIQKLEDTIKQPLLPAAQPKKRGRKPSTNKQPKVVVDKSIKELNHVTSQMLEMIESHSTVTAENCSDPGRLVVRRTVISSIIESVTGEYINDKLVNQLVVLATRKLPRQSMTINSTGSRFKYLLAEVAEGSKYSPAVQVLEVILSNPKEFIKQAKSNYQDQASVGLEAIQTWMSNQ